MVIKLNSDLATVLSEAAQRQGLSPEELANAVLRERFLSDGVLPAPQDQWERTVLGLATDCGVSLSHADLGTEGLYE